MHLSDACRMLWTYVLLTLLPFTAEKQDLSGLQHWTEADSS